MLTVMFARFVGNIYNDGLYDIRIKHGYGMHCQSGYVCVYGDVCMYVCIFCDVCSYEAVYREVCVEIIETII
jgi:hypothetical protein